MVKSRKRMVLGTIGLLVGLMLCTGVQAQRGQRGGGGFGGGAPGGFPGGMRGGFGFGGGPADLLQREDVQKELGMTEAQIDDARALADESRRGMGDLFRERMGSLRDMSDQERQDAMAEIQETRQKQQNELRDKAKDVLNRNQQARFAELEFQFALQRGDLTGALTAVGVELDQNEAEDLQNARQEAQADLRAKIAELQRDSNMEALETVVDRSKIERLAGAPFTFEATGGPGGGPRGRDPQARGRQPAGRERPDRGRAAEERTDRRSRRPARER